MIVGVFSGGGAFGAVQAAAFRSALRRNPQLEQMSRFFGTSVGSINIAKLIQAQEGHLLDEAESLVSMWATLPGNRAIYDRRFLCEPRATVSRNLDRASALQRWIALDGLYDTRPLRALLEQHVDPVKIKTSFRKGYVGAVEMQTGQLEYFDLASKDPVSRILASAAYPVFFKPEYFAREGNAHGVWLDGGVRDITPLQPVFALEPSEIHIFLTHPFTKKVAFRPMEHPGAFDILLRLLQIWGSENFVDDVCRATRKNGKEGYHHCPIYMYAPDADVWHDSLNFAPEGVARMIEAGSKVEPQLLE